MGFRKNRHQDPGYSPPAPVVIPGPLPKIEKPVLEMIEEIFVAEDLLEEFKEIVSKDLMQDTKSETVEEKKPAKNALVSLEPKTVSKKKTPESSKQADKPATSPKQKKNTVKA